MDARRGAASSVYGGLGGVVGPLFDNDLGEWGRMNDRFGGGRATVTVPAAGEHRVNVWIREDGLHLNRLLLMAEAAYTPAGAGPAATARA